MRRTGGRTGILPRVALFLHSTHITLLFPLLPFRSPYTNKPTRSSTGTGPDAEEDEAPPMEEAEGWHFL